MKRPRSQNGLSAEDYASYLWEYNWLHPAGVFLAAAEGRLTRARALYEQLYGIKYNDKKLIDRKFTELLVDGFRNAMASKPTSPDISIPLYILLAYFLRQGGGGRDRGRVKRLQIPEDKIAELRAKFPRVPISSSRKLNRREERETKIYVPLRGKHRVWAASSWIARKNSKSPYVSYPQLQKELATERCLEVAQRAIRTLQGITLSIETIRREGRFAGNKRSGR